MELNKELYDKMYAARTKLVSDPSVLDQGDIVILEDGNRMRVGHVYEDGSYQLTRSSNFFCQRGEMFLDRYILGNVHLSSGGLNASTEDELEYVGIEEAECWTWRELPCAGGGIDIMMPFRVFKIKKSIRPE